jgi:glycosyltransferase involved in cell wall biosynthesis
MTTDSLATTDLLVVAHEYNRFVKAQVDVVADHVRSVHVFVRYNRFADIAARLSVEAAEPYSGEVKVDRSSVPENVTVHETPLFYLPLDLHREHLLGRQHARKVSNAVADLDVDFDLVHAHMTWTAGYVGASLKRAFDIPYVLTVHANPEWYDDLLSADHDRIETAWEAADRVIRVNRRDRSRLEPYNDDVVYVPNGYDSDAFQRVPREAARERLGVDADTPLVFGLGTLIPRKGYQNLVRALPALAEAVPDVQVVVGGHGGMREDLESLAEDLGVADRVTFLGYVAEDELNDWMNAADVFAHPSRSESFGVVQLEAMACRTPVVAARNGGSEEVVADDDYGILVDDPTDHDRLAAALAEGLRTDWDHEAIAAYADRFTWEEVCADIADLYRDVLTERDRTAPTPTA